MKVLEDQLQELQGAKDALEMSRTKEDVLQKQVVAQFWFYYKETLNDRHINKASHLLFVFLI